MIKAQDSIARLLEQARSEYVYSGFQFHGEGPKGELSLAGGSLSHWKGAAPVSTSTYFDIGSVTKVVVTTTLCALAVDRSELALSDTVGKHVSALSDTTLGPLELGAVLSHSAGLEAWLPVGKETSRADLTAWFRKEAKRVLPRRSGEKAVYSDLGFLLLGLVLESKGQELGRLFQARVAGPLGLDETRYGPVKNAACAATEFSLETAAFWQGDVFDDNSRELEGATAHAGLFSTARGLSRWAKEWLAAVQGKSKWLGQKTAKQFVTRSNRAPASSWAYGWDTRSAEGSSAGSLFSPSAFGHLGYPGCSVWIDPEQSHFAIFHTNRVHPSRLDERVRQWRPRIHDAWAQFCRS